jgi:hypothetical protein
MSHRDEYGTTGGGCGVIVFAVVILLVAFVALTKGVLW